MGDQSFYILRLNTEVVEAALAAGGSADADGIDDAFELLNEVGVQGQGCGQEGESGVALMREKRGLHGARGLVEQLQITPCSCPSFAPMLRRLTP